MNVKMQNIPNLVSIIGMGFMHSAKSGQARAGTQLHVDNHEEHIRFWEMDELNVSWDDNICEFIYEVLLEESPQ